MHGLGCEIKLLNIYFLMVALFGHFSRLVVDSRGRSATWASPPTPLSGHKREDQIEIGLSFLTEVTSILPCLSQIVRLPL